MKELTEMKSHVDFPAHSLQSALLSGFDLIYPGIKVITSPPVSPYPKIGVKDFKPFLFSHNGGTQLRDAFVGALNLPLIRLISRFLRIHKELRKSLCKNESNILITYSLHTPFLLAAACLRKRIDKCCVIVPDLPQFMSGKKNKLYRMAKALDRMIINHCIRKYDMFVLLSPHMAEILSIEDKKKVVVDGIFGGSPEELENTPKATKKTILYTGDTADRCGVPDLIEAFKQIPGDDYELWLRGYGTNINEILENIKSDSRIKYFPPMPRTELLRLECQATVLVNPIRPSQKFTRYYFPSKTMEYLASGTPTVMYRLDCLSPEYDNLLCFVKEETIESLRDTLVSVCELPSSERQEIGERAKLFIKEKRNPYVQAEKIARMIEN